MKSKLKIDGLILGLLILIPSFFLQAIALEFADHNIFMTTVGFMVTGSALGALGLRTLAKKPLFKGISRKHFAIAVAIGLAALEEFLITAAIPKIGIGPAATIFALGPLFGAVWTHRGWRITDIGWRVVALVGVVLADGPWQLSGGSLRDHLIGLGLVSVAAVANWTYQTLIFGWRYAEDPLVAERERQRVVGAGLFLTAVFTAIVGAVGHFCLGVGTIPTSWPEVVVMTAMGIAVLTIPGIVYAKAGSLLPKGMGGFVFQLSTVASAVVGAVLAALGLVGQEQQPTPLAWVGVAVIVAVTARVGWNDARRRKAELIDLTTQSGK